MVCFSFISCLVFNIQRRFRAYVNPPRIVIVKSQTPF